MDIVQPSEMQNAVMRRIYFPTIRWGAILGGVVVGLAVHLMLTLLGVAAGLSAVNIGQGAGALENAPIWAGAWNGLSMLVAAFIGGYVAARMSGLMRTSDGVLHGFVAWAVSTLLFVWLASTAIGSLFGSVFGTITRGAAQTAATVGGGDEAAGLASRLEGLIKGSAQGGDTSITPQLMQTLQQRLQAGQREEAIGVLTNSMGFTQERAATVVDQALILSGSAEQASPGAVSAVNRTVETVSTATWAVFLAVALALALGIAGGAVGARGGARRKPREYTTTQITESARQWSNKGV